MEWLVMKIVVECRFRLILYLDTYRNLEVKKIKETLGDAKLFFCL